MKRRTANQAIQKTESTRAGEQHVVPGAEKITDAELAKRKASELLKAKINQKPADEALFGEGASQTDLIDFAAGQSPRNFESR
jgi:hypothetical protein